MYTGLKILMLIFLTVLCLVYAGIQYIKHMQPVPTRDFQRIGIVRIVV